MLLVAVNKIVASLLPVCCWIQKGIHVAEIQATCCRQHVDGNKQHVAGQHVARPCNMVTRLNVTCQKLQRRV